MPENKVNIELTGSESKFIATLNRAQAAVRSYSGKAIGAFKRVNQSIMHGYEKLGALEKIGIGFGAFEIAKDLIEFNDALLQIQRTSGASAADMLGLKQQIMDLTRDIPLSKGQFVEMTEAMNNAGLSMGTIKAILPQIGKGAVAAHVDVKEYAGTISELMEKYHVAASDLPVLQDQLNAAMKMEDVRKNPQEFLQSITGMAKTMQLLKTQGLGNVTPLLALQAQLTKFTGSAGEASGSIEGLFNGLLRLSKNRPVNAQLAAHGISFFNQGGGVKSIVELIPQFRKLAIEAQKSGRGIEQVAMAVFGRPEAAKMLMMVVQQYDEIMKKQEELQHSTGSMGKDFTMESESMTAKLKLFQNQLDRFKVDHMSGALQHLSNVLDFLGKHPIVTTGVLSAVGLAGIVVGVNKVVAAFKELGVVVTAIGNTGALKVIASVLGGVGGILAAEGAAAVAYQQAGSAEAAGLRKWRTQNAYDYAKSKEVMGGIEGAAPREAGGIQKWQTQNAYDYAKPKEVMGGLQGAVPREAGGIQKFGQPQNNINMTVHINMDQIRTATDALNTKIKVKRGDFNIGQ